ncbi:hypothetical protein BDK51DRAFT_46647 [Blyttiomyces helicus]|uniref:Uncharacterized protein n=1 Tax=Blyttiomyces helicus TaxID=388810 RepID=A0A4P9W781_9FUNG|nr:hypothetical protein BDK51DRAFT_46647 [Blyttiomyces helicus]|eukprot:RKO86868.1 hypothetical protein BDK51DRAFT_46647 [Blyttiomyces helicus]
MLSESIREKGKPRLLASASCMSPLVIAVIIHRPPVAHRLWAFLRRVSEIALKFQFQGVDRKMVSKTSLDRQLTPLRPLSGDGGPEAAGGRKWDGATEKSGVVDGLKHSCSNSSPPFPSRDLFYASVSSRYGEELLKGRQIPDIAAHGNEAPIIRVSAMERVVRTVARAAAACPADESGLWRLRWGLRLGGFRWAWHGIVRGRAGRVGFGRGRCGREEVRGPIGWYLGCSGGGFARRGLCVKANPKSYNWDVSRRLLPRCERAATVHPTEGVDRCADENRDHEQFAVLVSHTDQLESADHSTHSSTSAAAFGSVLRRGTVSSRNGWPGTRLQRVRPIPLPLGTIVFTLLSSHDRSWERANATKQLIVWIILAARPIHKRLWPPQGSLSVEIDTEGNGDISPEKWAEAESRSNDEGIPKGDVPQGPSAEIQHLPEALASRSWPLPLASRIETSSSP